MENSSYFKGIFDNVFARKFIRNATVYLNDRFPNQFGRNGQNFDSDLSTLNDKLVLFFALFFCRIFSSFRFWFAAFDKISYWEFMCEVIFILDRESVLILRTTTTRWYYRKYVNITSHMALNAIKRYSQARETERAECATVYCINFPSK